MRVRVRELDELSESEREQIADNFVWAEEHESEAARHWLVTLENNAVTIGFLVPKAEVEEHVSLN